MRQRIDSEFMTDGNGNPTGGRSSGLGIEIKWQDGPLAIPGEAGQLRERGQNGAFVEGVIQAAIDRLEFFQKASGGRFKCRENEEAIRCLTSSMTWLDLRTKVRTKRGVEGSHQP